MAFAKWFFLALVWGAMGLTSLSVGMLAVLVVRDWKDKKLW